VPSHFDHPFHFSLSLRLSYCAQLSYSNTSRLDSTLSYSISLVLSISLNHSSYPTVSFLLHPCISRSTISICLSFRFKPSFNPYKSYHYTVCSAQLLIALITHFLTAICTS
jgi:hypothetical protein